MPKKVLRLLRLLLVPLGGILATVVVPGWLREKPHGIAFKHWCECQLEHAACWFDRGQKAAPDAAAGGTEPPATPAGRPAPAPVPDARVVVVAEKPAEGPRLVKGSFQALRPDGAGLGVHEERIVSRTQP